MASNRYVGAAATIAQVDTITVGGTAAAGQVYSVTMGLNNAAVVSYTAVNGDTNNTIAAALQLLLAASTFPQFQEVTWTVANNVITGTAAAAGTPFTCTSSATGTGTLTTATTTANGSPSDVGNAANYSLNALPANGDDLYIDHSSVPLLYNLSALSAVTLNSLNVAASFTGTIGLPEVNPNGYEEYRPTYLSVGATTVNVGYGDGSGSGRIKLNTGSVQTALFVRQTDTGLETNLEALQWKGTHVANTVEVTRGSVAVAGYGGDAATVATLTVGYVTDQQGDAQVRCGPGTTLTTVNQSGGTLVLNGAATTITKTAGTLQVYGTGAVGTLTDDGGETDYLTTGTLSTLSVGAGCTFNVAEDDQARTVTNCSIYAGGAISDPFKTVTWTNPIQLVRCRIADVKLDLGENRKLAPS